MPPVWVEIDLFSDEVFKRQQSYIHVSSFGYCFGISLEHQKILCKEYDWNMASSSEEVLGIIFIDLKCKITNLATCNISPWKRLLCSRLKLNWPNGLEKKFNSMTTMNIAYGSSITLLIHSKFIKKLPIVLILVMLVQSSSKEDFQTLSPPQHAFVYVPLPLNSMNKRPMGHIPHLRKIFKSINTYDYIIRVIKRR